MFAVLDHSSPSLLEAGAVARARWFLLLLVLLAVVLLAAGCHNSSRQAAPPVTNNLSAGALQISTSQPRVGYPLEVVTAITAAEETEDVSVSYFALDASDVANERDEVRQFSLGTVTFPVVRPSITQYRATLTVPTSVTPPGDYVILCSIDPSSLVSETNEDDNRAQIAATIAPMEDPNLQLRELQLDSQSLFLDPDFDDVPSAGEGDVQNSDLGATLAFALEGRLDPVDVEAAVWLRITRTDRTVGQDTHDVPLYLWDSVAQRYIDAFGVQGDPEWLSLGSIAPERVTESVSNVNVETPGNKSVHLDVYLPGKLAETMIAILEQLPMGPPPVPPPDLRLEDILALQDFFNGARRSNVYYSFVAKVRATTPGFVDANPLDDGASQPLYLIMPGEESSAPDRPLAWSEKHAAGWENSHFGVGFEFESFASLDARGAVAGVHGAVPAKIFGQAFDFMAFDARAQVVPAVDPASVPDGETSGFSLDLVFAGQTVYSYQEELGYVFDGTFSVSKEKTFSSRFFLGPVPLSTTAGAGGEIGYQLTANLQPASLASGVYPFASLEASVEAGVGIAGILQAGAGGSLTLIEERFGGSVDAGLSVFSASPPVVFEGDLTMRVTNAVTGPTGQLYLFVEYPTIKWCWRVIPCGFKTARKTLTLATWHSFAKEDVLFEHTLCKRVRIDGEVTFALCGPQ